jgi:hypothetical protein
LAERFRLEQADGFGQGALSPEERGLVAQEELSPPDRDAVGELKVDEQLEP